MTTKKQKREAMKARHDAEMEEIRRTGLEAQRKDREHREKQKKKLHESWQKHQKHSRRNKVAQCPFCQEAN